MVGGAIPLTSHSVAFVGDPVAVISGAVAVVGPDLCLIQGGDPVRQLGLGCLQRLLGVAGSRLSEPAKNAGNHDRISCILAEPRKQRVVEDRKACPARGARGRESSR